MIATNEEKRCRRMVNCRQIVNYSYASRIMHTVEFGPDSNEIAAR